MFLRLGTLLAERLLYIPSIGEQLSFCCHVDIVLIGALDRLLLPPKFAII